MVYTNREHSHRTEELRGPPECSSRAIPEEYQKIYSLDCSYAKLNKLGLYLLFILNEGFIHFVIHSKQKQSCASQHLRQRYTGEQIYSSVTKRKEPLYVK